MRIFDHTVNLLGAALDARMQRHEVLSSNLANADTPGFMPLDVDVQRATAQQLQAEEAKARPVAPELELELGAPEAAPAGDAVVPMAETSAGLDGNGVDLDRNMAALAENGLEYGALARAVQKKLGILRYVVSDGQA